MLHSEEYAQIGVQFGFLTREATERSQFNYHLIQKERLSGNTIGGELFKLIKPNPERALFYSQAGSDATVKPNEIFQLNAYGIGEPAQYNWYDASGSLLFTGPFHTLQADSSMILKLEVIAESDGFKDYDEFNLAVMPHYIETISPNPASQAVNVTYSIDSAQALAAKISFIHHNTNHIYFYPVDIFDESINMDISALPQGNYTITLMVDSSPKHSLHFLKN